MVKFHDFSPYPDGRRMGCTTCPYPKDHVVHTLPEATRKAIKELSMDNNKPSDPRQLFKSIPHVTPVEVNTYMTRVCASYPSNTKEYASLIAAFTSFQVLLNSGQLPLRSDGTIKHPGDYES